MGEERERERDRATHGQMGRERERERDSFRLATVPLLKIFGDKILATCHILIGSFWILIIHKLKNGTNFVSIYTLTLIYLNQLSIIPF